MPGREGAREGVERERELTAADRPLPVAARSRWELGASLVLILLALVIGPGIYFYPWLSTHLGGALPGAETKPGLESKTTPGSTDAANAPTATTAAGTTATGTAPAGATPAQNPDSTSPAAKNTASGQTATAAQAPASAAAPATAETPSAPDQLAADDAASLRLPLLVRHRARLHLLPQELAAEAEPPGATGVSSMIAALPPPAETPATAPSSSAAPAKPSAETLSAETGAAQTGTRRTAQKPVQAIKPSAAWLHAVPYDESNSSNAMNAWLKVQPYTGNDGSTPAPPAPQGGTVEAEPRRTPPDAIPPDAPFGYADPTQKAKPFDPNDVPADAR